LPEYAAVEEPHQKFHETLAALAAAAAQEPPAAGEAALADLKKASSALLKGLDLLAQRITREA
jgi:hypothetical protein